MVSKYVSILVTMQTAEAVALVKFAKSVSVTAVRRTAKNSKESVTMQNALDRLLQALRDAGYGLPGTTLVQPCLGTEPAVLLLDPVTQPDKNLWS